jgi:hypothetical protein
LVLEVEVAATEDRVLQALLVRATQVATVLIQVVEEAEELVQ